MGMMRPRADVDGKQDTEALQESQRQGWRGTTLPPLNLLRTFEAAAWHVSFTRAAEELAITQSAVSQQIRQLEEHLGRRLFERLPQRLRLTTAGAIYADTIREALGLISRASGRLVSGSDEDTLTVLVSPSFANRWLIPQLEGFRRANPEIRIAIVSSPDVFEHMRQPVDLAVRWGNGRWPGMLAHYLGDQPILPVCSPAYLKARGGVRSAADLQGHTLLHLTRDNHWGAMLKQLGAAAESETSSLFFGDTSPMLEACVQGHGIGLSSVLLAADDLRAGRLVPAFDAALDVGHGFYVLERDDDQRRQARARFRDWIASEYRAAMASATSGARPESV